MKNHSKKRRGRSILPGLRSMEVIIQDKSNVIIIIMSIILFSLIVSYLVTNRESLSVLSNQGIEEKPLYSVFTVVVDPGHGGVDPGKIAESGVLEKDINLEIAFKLKKFLEAQDVKVIMTRNSDEGLYPPNAANKKVEDMKKRLNIIENAEANIAVSIHQNSYQKSSVHGAQVFYYTNSKAAKTMAETIQAQLISSIDPQNTREAKGNDSYYLLKKTTIPLAIVECGFLSNPAEAEKLANDYYQEKLAWAIHLGIMQYLNQAKE